MTRTRLLLLGLWLLSGLHYQAVACSITGPDEVCEGQEVWYELSTDLPGNSIIWYVEGGEVLQQNNIERKALIRFTTPGPGLVQAVHVALYPYFQGVVCSLAVSIATGPTPVILTDNSLCIFSGSGEGDNFSTCMDNQVRLWTSGQAGSSFSWSSPQAWVHLEDDDDLAWVTYSGNGMAEICVEEHTPEGCKGTACISIQVTPSPSAWYAVEHHPDSADIRICAAERLYFQAGFFAPDVHYRWTVLNADSAVVRKHQQSGMQGGAMWSHLINQPPGEYRVCLELALDPNFPCTSQAFCRTIRIGEGCRPPVICPSVVCAGETVEYCLDSTLMCQGYSWQVEGGDIVTIPATSRCIQVHWNDPGPGGFGLVKLEVDTCLVCDEVCLGPYLIPVPIISNDISIEGPDDGCLSPSNPNTLINMTWQVPFIPGATYYWDTLVLHGNIMFDTTGANTANHFYHRKFKFSGPVAFKVRCRIFHPLAGCEVQLEKTVKLFKTTFNIEGFCIGDTIKTALTHPLSQPYSVTWQITDIIGQVLYLDSFVNTGALGSPTKCPPDICPFGHVGSCWFTAAEVVQPKIRLLPWG